MKKWINGVFTVICLVLIFTACKDDDDNRPAFAPDGKRLVRSIVGICEKFPDEKFECVFSYNSDGRIVGIERKYTYMSEDLNKKCTDTEQVTFSVSGKELTVVTNYTDGEYAKYSGTFTGKFVLNEDGYMESGEEVDEDEDAFTYKCYYDDIRHLEKLDYTRNGRNEGPVYFTWNNGNLVKGVYGNTYTYWDKENKANIDFSEVYQDIWVLGYDRSNLGLVGYLGIKSKQLMKSGDDHSFTYEYDSEGYVTKFTESEDDYWAEDDDWVYVFQVNYN